jgi:hypothetical protein
MTLRDLLYYEEYGKTKRFIQNRFQLKGSYSGKIHYKSWYSSKKKLDLYLDLEVSGLYSSVVVDNFMPYEDNAFAVTTIWIQDYEIATKKKEIDK